MELNLEKNIENNLELKNEQNGFLGSLLGKVINNGVDIGLRYIFPDFIEDEIIDLKNNLIQYGLKDGITKSIQSVVETGKAAIGLITDDFKSISQVQAAVKSGGLIDSISDLLDNVLDRARDYKGINSNVISLIQDGKNSILNNIEKNVQKTFYSQISGIEKIEENINNWKNAYNQQNFDLMDKNYKMIKNEIKELIPIQNTLDNVKTIDLLHNLIKNNNGKFNISKEELELAEKLSIA